MSDITPGHVMAVLEPIRNEKRETARRVKQRISAICRWAVAQGHRTGDPAGIVIDAALPRNGVERRHMPALPYDEVAECVAKVKASKRASASSKLALEFLVLTAARSSEVRKATWDEIDIEGAVWTLPAERMKANREHRVPLLWHVLVVPWDRREGQMLQRVTLRGTIAPCGSGTRAFAPWPRRIARVRCRATWCRS
ncbi:MAG: site-specific integrase [Gammaproteobacteria bacterium]|nr:site-specific integrase [Gammaproteobacteria bacterium]